MCLKKSPVAQDVASFHLFAGPILGWTDIWRSGNTKWSGAWINQRGMVPRACENVTLWCGLIWWCSFLSWSVPVTGRQSDWHLGTGILETRFKVPPSKIWCLMLVAPKKGQFQLSVCLRYQKVKQKSYNEVQDLHFSTFLLIFKDGTAQWRMKNYGTAHFRGQS